MLTLAVLVLAVPHSASGAGYNFKETFGEVASPGFGRPVALAVDPASSDLLVVDGVANTISRFNPDGTPDSFSALGTNVIDGNGNGNGPGTTGIHPCAAPIAAECDETPQNGLDFGSGSTANNGNPRAMQVAVAPPGAAGGTAGDIYVTQFGGHLVDVFSSNGEYLGQLTNFKAGPAAEGAATPFGVTVGVAVDSAGAVYVSASPAEIHKYIPTANPVSNANSASNFTRPGTGHVATPAGPGAGFIYSAEFAGAPAKVDSASGAQQCLITGGESFALVANPEDGHLFNASSSEVKEYEGTCDSSPEAVVSSFAPGPGMVGIAVDGATGLIYVSREGQTKLEVWEPVITPEAVTKPATNVTDSSATLNGEVNPNGQPLTACFFEWGTTTSYGNIAPCDDPDFEEVGEDSSPVAVHADLEGLEAGTTYHFKLVAENTNGPGEGDDEDFQTPGPALREQTVSGVTASGAKIGANLNPQGEESGFLVAYLDEEAYLANPEAERFLGATQTPEQKVPALVTGTGNLIEGSPIVSLVNTTAGAFGPGQQIEGPGIPSNTTVVEVLSPTELKLSKAASEEIAVTPLTATGFQPIAQQLSGLDPQSAYHFRIIASNPSGTATGPDMAFTTFALPGEDQLPEGRAYEMVSPNQKTGEVIPPETDSGQLGGSCTECLPGGNLPTLPMQAAPDGDSVLYEGQPFSGGLAAGPNEYVSTRGSNEWDWESLSTPVMNGRYEAFSSDLSLGVLFQRTPALSPEAPVRGGEAFPNLYRRDEDGAFQPLITVEPPQREPEGFRARYAGANAGTAFVPEFSHLIFEANDALTEAVPGTAPAAPKGTGSGECTFTECNLYEWGGGELRLISVLPDNATATTEAVIGSGQLLVPAPGFEAPNVDHAISDDGSRIFWSEPESGQVYARIDGEQTLEIPGPGLCEASVALANRVCFLTASADGSEVLLSDGELFEFDAGANEYVKSADLTEGQGGFKGILGAAEDLSHVYFVDTAALTGGEENANGETAEAGKLNLFVFEEGDMNFIGILLAADNALALGGRYGAWKASRPNRTAQVSPDGEWLAFMSRAQLSGYDNRLAGGGECTVGGGPLCREVFVYGAQSGMLVCSSCNPSGQRPVGPSNLSLLNPGTPPGEGYPPFPQPGNLTDAGEGRLFFETQDSLLPQDTNGTVQDIYEWVPDGIGNCEQPQGCIYLITTGQAPNDSMLLDSTPSGEDAFFITRERLVLRDKDDQLDLYDARVGGGFEETPSAPCVGEACKEPISSPPVRRGALPPFVGAGNSPAKPTCRKGFVKKKGKCVKKKPKKKKKGKGQRRKRGDSR